jgi:hypothetical protein
MFFFCFDAGKFYMDRLQHIDMAMSMGMSFAGVWTITRVLKIRKQARERVTVFSIIAVLLIPSIIGGFLAGKEAQYPAESRALVEEIQLHARDLKSVKEQISKARESFTDPEQILSLQPLITSVELDINEISRIDQEIKHDTLPGFVAEALKIMNEALVFNKTEMQDIKDQMSVVRAAKELSPTKKADLYKRRLLPLMEQEEEIEKQIKDFNIEQRIKDALARNGYK